MATEASHSIFVVDDDQGLLRLMQRALQREGFTVRTASSGSEAIAWLGRNQADLMLLDLKLQDMAGKELVERLAAIQRPTPFIIITGQGDERVAVDMIKRGALDYLVKGVDFVQFVPEVVRRALDQLSAAKRIKDLEKEVREISEREQRRIGQDLHDGLGQQLTAIELMSESLRSDLAAGDSSLEPRAAQVCQFLREAIRQARSLSRGLAAYKVETEGLQAALIELAGATSALGRLKCRVECDSPLSLADRESAVQLYRIAQEAINNAVKHSRASELTIHLSSQNGLLRLQVRDNGRGLPRAGKPDHGMGLRLMKHRASMIGADLEVLSKPGAGVTVACTLRKNK